MLEEGKNFICLSFEEINVLLENVQVRSLPDLIVRLDNLIQNTTDSSLQKVLNSVLNKVKELTPNEYKILLSDIEQGKVLFPPFYRIPVYNKE